ncbi:MULTISPECIES: MFS transporter [unclassified Moorena]|uniref:MFS transporter n=1 Tax=unclassified Moorena TaxID=2683338 RepID=UPI0025D05E65|nr:MULTISPECIES: MFS transporter [unclassified Moorena]
MNQTTDTQQQTADDGKPSIISAITKRFPSLQGMETFTFIWFGQVISLIGTSLTSFALSIWVYQQTDSVTQFSLPVLSAAIPPILIGPIAGVYVDRWSRRWTMIISDFSAGLCTLLVAWLYLNGSLEIWHICLTNVLRSSFSTFQGLAYSAATTLLVPKANLGRASGMVFTGQAISDLAAPTFAVTLLAIIQLPGIIAIDFITLLFALVALLIVKFPELSTGTDEQTEQESFLHNLTYGWNYFVQRPGLLGLVLLVALCNFLIGATQVLDIPLVLSFASVTTLGIVVSFANAGMVIGGLIMTIWGGWQNQMTTVFISMFAIGLCVLLVGLRPSAILLACANFSMLLTIPIVNSAIQAIYQRKVAPEVQGRVFAFRKSVALATLPLSYVIAGPLADRFFEPLMTQDSIVAKTIGRVIGTGPGRGIGLMFISMGVLTILMTCIAYLLPRLRYLEDELPDAIGD